MKILVVDNNDIVQKICTYVFEKLGHEVHVASTGAAALKFISEQKFDFVFLELFLRDMSGLTILEKLKNQNILSVIMTSYHSVESITKAVELGASSYMFKPIDPENLEATLVMCKKRAELDFARTEAKQKLLESQQKYKTLVDGISEGIVIMQAGKVRFLNKSMADLLGLKIPRIINKSGKDIFVSKGADRVWRRMMDFMEAGVPIEGNYGFRNFHGTQLTLFVSGTKMNFENKPADMFVFNDVTERIEATKKMKKIEERYRIIHEHASDAFFLIDQDGDMHEVNRVSEVLLGYGKDELLAMNLRNLIVDDDVEKFLMLFQELKNLGGVPPTEIRLKTKSGRPLLMSISAVFIDFNSYLIILYDLSSKKIDRTETHETEILYKNLLDFVPGVVYKKSIDGQMSFLDDKILDLLHYPKEMFISNEKVWTEIVTKDFREHYVTELSSLILGKNKTVLEYQVQCATGEIIWLRDHVVCSFDETGTPIFYEGIIFDITNQKNLDQKLMESEKKFKNLLEHLPVVVYQIQKDLENEFSVNFVNDFVEDFLGYTSQEVNDKNLILTNVHEADITAVYDAFNTFIKERKQGFRLVYRMLSKEGNVLKVVNRGSVVVDNFGNVFIEGTIVDVTSVMTRVKETHEENVFYNHHW